MSRIPKDVWIALAAGGGILICILFDLSPVPFVAGFCALCAYVVCETFKMPCHYIARITLICGRRFRHYGCRASGVG
jgi:hypothetical protein